MIVTRKRISLLLTLITVLSVCFFVKPVWADESNAVKTIVIQTSPEFIPKNDQAARITSTKVMIYAFTANKGEAQPKPSPGEIKLTVTLTNSQGESLNWEQQLVISEDATFGEVSVQFPSEGQWTISATGTLEGKPLSTIDITTNTSIVYIGTPKELNLSPEIASINVNKTQQYTAQLIYSDNSSYDVTKEVSWSTASILSSKEVASIDEAGLAKGQNVGIAKIIADDSVSGLTQDALLFVVPDLINVDLTLTPLDQTIGVGDTEQFKAVVSITVAGLPLDQSDVTSVVDWASSRPGIATIGSSGAAKGLSPGITEITATLPLVNKTAVTFLSVEGLKLVSPGSPIAVGEKVQFSLTLIKSNLEEEDVTNATQWTSSDLTVARIDTETEKGSVIGLAPGRTTITAAYSGMSASAVLEVQGSQTLGQFAFVNPPRLKLRSDVDPNSVKQSTWSYIGEPMLLDIYLQAYTKEGVPIKDYLWDISWFMDKANWDIRCADPLQRLDASKMTYSMLTRPKVEGESILHAQFLVIQNDSTREKVIRNASLSVKLKDIPGIMPMTALQAEVQNQVTTFTLYGGQIRVAPGYFYQENALAQVYVEKYDENLKNFVQNYADSLTSVSSWDLSGAEIPTIDFQFIAGSGTVSVHSNTSNLTKTLKPSSYPSYLGVVEGPLTWGQIVDNPPPQNPLQKDEGPVWERELAP